MITIAKALVEPPPRLKGLSRPDPETRGDSHYHGHQVFDHEHGEVWGHGGKVVSWALDGKALTGLHVPGSLPLLPEGLLIEVTGDYYSGWHCVEDTEHTNSNHELLQLLCLGTIMLHDSADAEQRDKSSQEERRADKQVDEKWR